MNITAIVKDRFAFHIKKYTNNANEVPSCIIVFSYLSNNNNNISIISFENNFGPEISECAKTEREFSQQITALK